MRPIDRMIARLAAEYGVSRVAAEAAVIEAALELGLAHLLEDRPRSQKREMPAR